MWKRNKDTCWTIKRVKLKRFFYIFSIESHAKILRKIGNIQIRF